eukprot:gene21294-28225_t
MATATFSGMRDGNMLQQNQSRPVDAQGQHFSAEVPSRHPASIDEAKTYINRTVLKYFQPVPVLNYPGGNAAGLVADVQIQAGVNGEERLLFLVKYGESYEELLPWDQLVHILVPHSASMGYEAAQAIAQAYAQSDLGMHGQMGMTSEEVAKAQQQQLASNRKPAQKRHRPYRYIQLPINMAHPHFGNDTLPMTLNAKMWVDGEFVMELPAASLIRCVHPRTQYGHQYQLYGVQEFRKKYSERPLKVVSVSKNSENTREVDIHFVNVVMEDGAWRATERDNGVPVKFRSPLVPSAFIQKNFPEGVFPVEVRIVVELNGEMQPAVHQCTLHHDARAKVYRLRDDRSLCNMYKNFDIAVDCWKKMDASTLQMCCRGGLRPPPDPNMPKPESQQDMNARRRGRPKKPASNSMDADTETMLRQHQHQQDVMGDGGHQMLLQQQQAVAEAVAAAGLLPEGVQSSQLDPHALAAAVALASGQAGSAGLAKAEEEGAFGGGPVEGADEEGDGADAAAKRMRFIAGTDGSMPDDAAQGLLALVMASSAANDGNRTDGAEEGGYTHEQQAAVAAAAGVEGGTEADGDLQAGDAAGTDAGTPSTSMAAAAGYSADSFNAMMQQLGGYGGLVADPGQLVPKMSSIVQVLTGCVGYPPSSVEGSALMQQVRRSCMGFQSSNVEGAAISSRCK